MTTVTKAELKQLAGQARLVGELIDADGEIAWDTTLGWELGPCAANTGPGGGNRVDDDLIPITLNDPTGDAAVNAMEILADDSAHEDLRAHLVQLKSTTGVLIDLLRTATPHMPRPDKQHLVEKGLREDGWCVSCYRDHGHLEPIEKKPNGTPYYVGLCRWCGQFKAKQGVVPPVELLSPRHQGKRITEAMVQRAMAKRRKKKNRR